MNIGTFGGLSPFNIHRKVIAYICIVLYSTHHGKRLHESCQIPVSVLAIFHTCHSCVSCKIQLYLVHSPTAAGVDLMYICFCTFIPGTCSRSACVAWFLLLTIGACLLLASIDILLMLRGTRQYLQLSFNNLNFCQCMSCTAEVWRLRPSSSRSCYYSLG